MKPVFNLSYFFLLENQRIVKSYIKFKPKIVVSFSHRLSFIDWSHKDIYKTKELHVKVK